MAQETPIPLAEEHRDPDASLTLESARERLRLLLPGGERNAWEIGHLLNTIEKSGLVGTKGYKKTKSWLGAEVPEAKAKVSTLYRYANVAGQYSQADVDRWGTAKLYCLMIHEGETHEATQRGDTAEREVQLRQADGSILVKKFRNCSCQELRLSQRRKTSPAGSESGKVQACEEPVHSQAPAAKSTQSIGFFRAQIAKVALRTRKLLWPFTRAG
jgi:hypothetical protein